MTKNLFKASKRKREVHLKKMILLVFSLCMVVILSGFCGNLADAHGSNSETPVTHKYYKSIEIKSGDTLWDIAKEYMNDNYSSVYDYIYEIQEINNLKSDKIHEGQYLTIVYSDTDFK